MTPAELRDWLGTGTAVLDGGLATELEARGHALVDALWSARILTDDPDAIGAVHSAYFAAGAEVAITASYQASFDGFQRAGLSRADTADALARSVAIARAAADAAAWRSRRPLVAASIGPYGAALANGAEFTGAYDLDEDALVRWHAERLAVLADAGADLLACETIPSAPEARALARLLTRRPSTAAWIAFSCRDALHLCDGTPIARVAAELADGPFVALGVNCTAPTHVAGLLRHARTAAPVPLVAYPNSGETWDAARRAWTGPGDPADFARSALAWRASGARLIGGCCRTTPAHIRQLHDALAADPLLHPSG